MNLRNRTTLEFRTVLGSPLGVPNSQVSLYIRLILKQGLALKCSLKVHGNFLCLMFMDKIYMYMYRK